MLKGSNICIRTIKEADLEVLFDLLNDIDSLGEFLPVTLTSETKLRSQYAENGFISDKSEQYLITSTEDEIIGSIWSFKSVPYFDALEVGYHIFEGEHRGKGYATQALGLFCDYIFQSTQVNRLELRIATENSPSEKIAIRQGFKLEGTHREAAYSKGKLHDMHTYALLRRQWQVG
ncbi:MAG: GNAT family N-acetyltransferase [Pseudomonadales bacterium]|nr:GNAT family N-acetyltransferase [Pseudomonadales bacterium]